MSTRREDALDAAGRVLAAGYTAQQSMTPRQQAEAAYDPAGDLTVDQLEDLIREQRGLEPRARSA